LGVQPSPSAIGIATSDSGTRAAACSLPTQAPGGLATRSHDAGRAIEVAVLAAREVLPIKLNSLAGVQRSVAVSLDAAEDGPHFAWDPWGREDAPALIVVPELHRSLNHRASVARSCCRRSSVEGAPTSGPSGAASAPGVMFAGRWLLATADSVGIELHPTAEAVAVTNGAADVGWALASSLVSRHPLRAQFPFQRPVDRAGVTSFCRGLPRPQPPPLRAGCGQAHTRRQAPRPNASHEGTARPWGHTSNSQRCPAASSLSRTGRGTPAWMRECSSDQLTSSRSRRSAPQGIPRLHIAAPNHRRQGNGTAEPAFLGRRSARSCP
jgi:hypothetical protein